jgi:Domain of unknown function (DUF5666)
VMVLRVRAARQWTLVLVVLVFGVVLTTAGCGKPAAGGAGAATPSPPSTAGMPAPPSAPSGHRSQHRSPKVVGEITAINGSTWTVRTAGGPLFTVSLTPATHFGTLKHPATREQFSVGSHVSVHGTISGATITATQITLQKSHVQ